MCSPNRFGKVSGNTWGRKRKRRRTRKKEKRENASLTTLEALLGSIGPSWDLLGGDVGAI